MNTAECQPAKQQIEPRPAVRAEQKCLPERRCALHGIADGCAQVTAGIQRQMCCQFWQPQQHIQQHVQQVADPMRTAEGEIRARRTEQLHRPAQRFAQRRQTEFPFRGRGRRVRRHIERDVWRHGVERIRRRVRDELLRRIILARSASARGFVRIHAASAGRGFVFLRRIHPVSRRRRGVCSLMGLPPFRMRRTGTLRRPARGFYRAPAKSRGHRVRESGLNYG